MSQNINIMSLKEMFPSEIPEEEPKKEENPATPLSEREQFKAFLRDSALSKEQELLKKADPKHETANYKRKVEGVRKKFRKELGGGNTGS